MERKKTLPIALGTAGLFAIAALVAVYWRHAPRETRNHFGNPEMETLKESCVMTEKGLTVRLYEGDGGATSATWYTATVEPTDHDERQFFYAYGSPIIERIECQPGGVTLTGSNGGEKFRESYPIQGILEHARLHPTSYYRGKRD